jgi:hypothetical protein
MSLESLLTLLISLLAAVISTVSLHRSRKIAAKQLELQAAQAKLAEFQHKVMTAEQSEMRRADLRVEVQGAGTHRYFIFSNLGPAAARNVSFAFFGGRRAPVVAQQFDQVFPIAELRAAESHRLAAAITLDMPSVLEGEFSWTNIDGVNETCRCKIVL